MNKVNLLKQFVFLALFMSALFYLSEAYSRPVKPVKESPGCQKNLEICQDDLDMCDTDFGTCETDLGICETDLMTCEDESQTFPGDGYPDPSFGTNGHGPALSYTDNGDGTFTDNNTGCMWETKGDSGGVHDKDNTYTWSSTGTDFDGTLQSDFLSEASLRPKGRSFSSVAYWSLFVLLYTF